MRGPKPRLPVLGRSPCFAILLRLLSRLLPSPETLAWASGSHPFDHSILQITRTSTHYQLMYAFWAALLCMTDWGATVTAADARVEKDSSSSLHASPVFRLTLLYYYIILFLDYYSVA